jgi:hypothetical protein
MTEVEKELAAYLKSLAQDDDTSSVSPSDREDFSVPKKGKFSPQAVDTQRSSAGEFVQFTPDQGSDPKFRTQQIYSREPPEDEEPTGAPNAPENDSVDDQPADSDEDSEDSEDSSEDDSDEDSDEDSEEDSDLDDVLRSISRFKDDSTTPPFEIDDHSTTPSFDIEDSSSEAANKENYFGDDGDARLDFLKALISGLVDDDYDSDDETDGFGNTYDRQTDTKKRRKKKKKHSSSKGNHGENMTSKYIFTLSPSASLTG